MKNTELELKINDLFEQSENNEFENHMPEKVAEFLNEVTTGSTSESEFKEDVEFARAICEVLN